LPPAVLASADQWLAGSKDSMSTPLASMRVAIAAGDTEAQLAGVAISLAAQSVGNAHMCQGLAAAYILCLYELARTQMQLEAQSRKQPGRPWGT
jgi:hypothetical protein